MSRNAFTQLENEYSTALDRRETFDADIKIKDRSCPAKYTAMRTSELIGAALDWAVAKCLLPEGWNDAEIILGENTDYSTDWALGGTIIEHEKISTLYMAEQSLWWATNEDPGEEESMGYDGPTTLIAAMRCYVASKLGDEVEIPKGLQ